MGENFGRKRWDDDDIPWPSFSVTKGPKRKGSLFSKPYFSRGELLNFRTQISILIVCICFIEYKSYNNPDIDWFTNGETGIKQPYADLWGTLPRTHVASQKEINLPNIDL